MDLRGMKPFEPFRYLAIAAALLIALAGPLLTVCRATDPTACGESGVCWANVAGLGCDESVAADDACNDSGQSEACACSRNCCDGTPVFHSTSLPNTPRPENRDTTVTLSGAPDSGMLRLVDSCQGLSLNQPPPDLDRLQSQRTVVLLI